MSAWGLWVLAKLRRTEHVLRDRIVEIHTGDDYFQATLLHQAGATVWRATRGPLVRRAARLARPTRRG